MSDNRLEKKSGFKNLLASLLPGIFLIGYNIGTGSLTAMSKAGARYGTELLWAVLLSCLITWYLINFFSRFTMSTGMTAMEGYRKHIHPAYAWVLWGALSIIILSALMAMIGLLADVLVVWCEEMWQYDLNRKFAGIGLAIFVYGLILIGNTKRFEAMLSVMVALMGLAFIGSAIWFFPDIKAVLKGFIPSIPPTIIVDGKTVSPMVILPAMVGTTVSVFAFLIRSGQVKDQGWTMDDWKIQKRDALVSASMMFVLSAAVVLTATSTLHAEGYDLKHIKEMIPMLKPLFGPLALFVFAIGIMAAGTSSHLPNMMVIPWLTDDLNGKARNTRTGKKRIILALLTIVSIFGVFIEKSPILLLLLSQAGISFVMPMALLGIIYLSARHIKQPEHRPKKIEWALLTLIVCFAFFMSGLAAIGFKEKLNEAINKDKVKITNQVHKTTVH
jgi:Mn2+/Fe2+ NRAMP family transporter